MGSFGDERDEGLGVGCWEGGRYVSAKDGIDDYSILSNVIRLI